jgi:myo-inositol-1(or 4)-monophosphatase
MIVTAPPYFDPARAKDLLSLAQAAGREAAALLASGYRKNPAVEKKGRIDLVTEFDKASERLLRERLGQSGIPVVGEELGGERAHGDAPTWVVDPLDGTTNFVHGHPFYCVSIGLLVGARPVLGVVVAPSLATEWTGLLGDGAMRNGEPCRVSQVGTLVDALLATGFPYDHATSPEHNYDAFIAIKRQCQAVRRCGSAALDLCLVADGTYDGYWERKLKPWDVAGGAAIVGAAGGAVTAFDGSELDVFVGRVLATNGHLHAELIHQLARVPPLVLPT